MLLLAGTGLWLIAALIVSVLFRAEREAFASPLARWIGLALLLAASMLMLRPHQDIFGGQDPGVYLNNAGNLLHRKALIFEDPWLKQVPLEHREQFTMIAPSVQLTTGRSLHIVSLEDATLGPWFQPAYAILMSLPGRLSPKLMHFVVPLFALLSALVLAAIARRLSGRNAAALAFVFFLFNSLTAWHGRAARPEYIALFFLLAGFYLAAFSPRGSWLAALLAGIALGLAPLFHVTAWLASIPLALLCGALLLGGQARFLPALLAQMGGALVFLYQTLHITDCYRIAEAVKPFERFAVPLGAFFAVAFLLFMIIGRKQGASLQAGFAKCFHPRLRIVFAALSGILLVYAYLNSGSNPGLGKVFQPLVHLWMSDLKAFGMHLSPFLLGTALAGWIALLIRPDFRGRWTLVLALAWLPGMLLMGDMPISMYFLRRSILFLAPMTALALAALVITVVGLAKLKGRKALVTTAALALVLSGLGLPGRTHFFTMVKHRGVPAFLESYAEPVREENGVLLCEYARLATPMFYWFGLEGLPLDIERGQDYGIISATVTELMRAHPDRVFFLLSPFKTKPEGNVKVARIKKGRAPKLNLQESKTGLATRRPTELNLALYRMEAPDDGSPVEVVIRARK